VGHCGPGVVTATKEITGTAKKSAMLTVVDATATPLAIRYTMMGSAARANPYRVRSPNACSHSRPGRRITYQYNARRIRAGRRGVLGGGAGLATGAGRHSFARRRWR
jgi:hypothetical protein